MPFFVKRATMRVPAAGSPVQAAPGQPDDDLIRDADAHAFRAKLDQGRWHRPMDLIGPLISQIPWACRDDPAAFGWARARALAAIAASG